MGFVRLDAFLVQKDFAPWGLSDPSLRLEEFKDLLSKSGAGFWQELITGKCGDRIHAIKLLHSLYV